MNLLSRGDALLGRKAPIVAGETVLVMRAGVVLCEAWEVFHGPRRIELLTDGEISVVSGGQDWIGDPAELRYDGQRTELERGDTCQWINGDYVFTFEAQPAIGENVTSPHGPKHARIVSHWKLIDWKLNE
jgi:hypothetical protein